MLERIRTRDVLAIGALTFVVVLTLSAFHVLHLAGTEVASVDRHARSLAGEIAALASEALSEKPAAIPEEALAADGGLARLIQAQTAHVPYLVYVKIASPDGRVLQASPQSADEPRAGVAQLSALAELNPLRQLWSILREGNLLELSTPLERDGKQIAALHLGFDTSLMRASLMQALRGSLSVGALALSLSFLVALFVARLTQKPIRLLSKQIERLREGDFERRAHERYGLDFRQLSEELALLGEEFQSNRLLLLAEKATLEHVIDHMQDAVLLLDPKERILFFNAAFRQVVGRSVEELVGEELEDVLGADHPPTRIVRHAAEAGRSFERVECRLPTADRFRECLASAFQVPASNGKESGTVLIAEDLGSLRTLQALVSHGARASELQRATAGVIHEVKNPLHSIGLHLEVLKRAVSADDEEARASLEAIGRALRDLDHVAKNFLEYVRPRKLERVELDLSTLLSDVVSFLQPEVRQRGIEVELALPEDRAAVLGDETALRQVLLNLLQNAFDATKSGGSVRVRASVEARTIEVAIRDDGAGIAPEELEKVFQLYYTTKADGSGIGLPMARRLIELHGGHLTLESERERGTTVRLRLPLAEPVPQAVGTADGGEEARA